MRMINLLSQERQKQIYREYLMRIGILLMLCIGIASTFFVATLLPSYVLLQSQIDRVSMEHKTRVTRISSEDQKELAEAQAFVSKVNVLREKEKPTSVVELTQQILSLKGAGITVIEFSYGNTAGAETLLLRGKADTRESLIALKSSLDADGRFSAIDLPVQTLIKGRDIDFSMKLVLAPRTQATPTPPALPNTPDTASDTEPLP